MSDNLYGLLKSRFPADRSHPCFVAAGGGSGGVGSGMGVESRADGKGNGARWPAAPVRPLRP